MKIRFFILPGILCSAILFLSWNQPYAPAALPAGYHDTISDIDGNEIYTVIIGKQEWTVHNLNTEHFRNGDAIPQAITIEEWIQAWKEKRPAWCYYEGKKPSSRYVGKLYNFYAMTDPRGIAPKGWRVPSPKDWDELITLLGGFDAAGKCLKFWYGWTGDNTGTNSSGFKALPGGYRNENGNFYNNTKVANWWIAPDAPNAAPSCMELHTDPIPMRIEARLLPGYGISIRCIKE